MGEVFNTPTKSGQRSWLKSNPIVWAVFLLWVASIALALEIQTILSIPAGVDPSFYYALVAFFSLLCLLAVTLIWRNILNRTRKLEGKLARYTAVILVSLVILLFVDLITGVLLYSANSASLSQLRPLLFDEPRPDYSFSSFPTPINPQPTATYDPGAVHLSGNILSSMDGFRIGSISLTLSPSDTAISSIQLYVNRLPCTQQNGSQVTNFAVDESRPFIYGPISIQDQSFFVSQGVAVIHGIMESSTAAHGTIYLRYTDPASGKTCDLGTGTWTAAAVH